MRKIAWLVWNEALAERRAPQRLPTIALFAVGLLLTLHFALPPEHEARPLVAPGFLWAAILFSSMLEVRRGHEADRSDGTLDGLRLAPLDPSFLFVARVASTLTVLALLEAILVCATAVFFGSGMAGVPAAYGVAVLATIGLASWGVLFAAVTSQGRAGDVVLPILLFPLAVPQTIAGVRLLGHYLGGVRLDSVSTGFVLLGAFDLLAVGTSLLLFEYVLQD